MPSIAEKPLVAIWGASGHARVVVEGVKQALLAFEDCKARLDLTRFLQAEGFSLPVAIHPRAVVANQVEMDAGTVIAAGAVVNPGAELAGVSSFASVDHDCVIGDAAHICRGVHLAGRVTVGEAHRSELQPRS
jgi:UDP-N-acetylbacillosamine N-acetyltransferase